MSLLKSMALILERRIITKIGNEVEKCIGSIGIKEKFRVKNLTNKCGKWFKNSRISSKGK